MLFKEVIGQKDIKNKLRQTVKDNRISHAQLFHGNEGTGGLALALAFSQYINCESRTPEDSCGQCASCLKYQKLIHPDLHFVFPVVKTEKPKKSISDDYIIEWRELLLSNSYITLKDWYEVLNVENKQGSIYEAESSSIIKKLLLKSYEAKYKIMIIWKPDKMNITSANRLLKLIEEPPPKTILLMVTDQVESILPTILSRTFKVKVNRIDDQDMFAALKVHSTLSDEKLRNIVNTSEGSYSSGLSNLEKNEENAFNFENLQFLMRNAFSFYHGKSREKKLYPVEEINEWAEKFSQIGRERQKSFLQNALRLIRENFVYNFKKPEILYLTAEELEWAEKFSPYINSENISKIAEEINQAYYHIERNANGKIVFFDLTLKLGKLLKKE